MTDARAAKRLDKYYTDPEVAALCIELLHHHNPVYRYGVTLIEPSAGAGAFLSPDVVAFDIAPEHPSIHRLDFLTDDLPASALAGEHVAFIGNPPFGKRGDLAIRFINRALAYAPVVGFILPLQFRKWATQKLIDSAAKLVVDHDLPFEAFTFMGQPYGVGCSFQVWSRESITLQRDRRIRSAPATAHPDFEMWQYNRTAVAEKYFHYPWHFAVLRQGYGDYRELHPRGTKLDRRKQWAFFKADDDTVRQRLMAIDYGRLSRMNAATPGFGKADVVAAYIRAMGRSR